MIASFPAIVAPCESSVYILMGVPSWFAIWIWTFFAASVPASIFRRPVARSSAGLAGSNRIFAMPPSTHSALPPIWIWNPRSPDVWPAAARLPALISPKSTVLVTAPEPGGLPSTRHVVAVMRPVISMVPSLAARTGVTGMAMSAMARDDVTSTFMAVTFSLGEGQCLRTALLQRYALAETQAVGGLVRRPALAMSQESGIWQPERWIRGAG